MKRVYPATIQNSMSQSGNYLLTLLEPQEQRQIPIVIGRYEAHSIMLAQTPEVRSKLRRPSTYQLMLNMMQTYGLTISKVTIDKVIEGVFYATLHISDGFNEHELDSRTTDAITLALITDVPIYADERVIEEASIQIENDEEKDRTESENDLHSLEEELRRCEENEDYEQAARIQSRIDRLLGKKH